MKTKKYNHNNNVEPLQCLNFSKGKRYLNVCYYLNFHRFEGEEANASS